MKRIAFIGLGAMGRRMAANLVEAGFDIVVYNRSDGPAQALVEAGAERAATPREAARRADLVMSIVTDDAASRAIWTGDDGALAGLTDGTFAVESSTITPAWALELAALVVDRGARFLDAPVLGTRPHAEGRELTYLVGGAVEDLDAVRGVLGALSSGVRHAGPVGAGAALKLGVNAFMASQVAAFSELVGVLTRSGFERRAAIKLLAELPVASPVIRRLSTLMLAQRYSPNFPIDLVEKDLRYAVQLAGQCGAETPTVAAARDVFAAAIADGLGADDISGLIQRFVPADDA